MLNLAVNKHGIFANKIIMRAHSTLLGNMTRHFMSDNIYFGVSNYLLCAKIYRTLCLYHVLTHENPERVS